KRSGRRYDGLRQLPMRVVVADDAPLIREGVARLLTENGVEVVDQVGDAGALLSSVRDLRPDVALVDIRMPPTHTDEGLRASREREILALMAEGRSNQGICRALWLSPKTVETHIRGAFAKLGIAAAPEDNRRVLAVLAFLQR